MGVGNNGNENGKTGEVGNYWRRRCKIVRIRRTKQVPDSFAAVVNMREELCASRHLIT